MVLTLLEQVEQLADILSFLRARSVKADHAVPPAAPLGVDRLVGGNRVKPRPNHTSRLVLVALQMHLQKRSLESVFGHLRVTQIPSQVAIQFPLVPMHELGK